MRCKRVTRAKASAVTEAALVPSCASSGPQISRRYRCACTQMLNARTCMHVRARVRTQVYRCNTTLFRPCVAVTGTRADRPLGLTRCMNLR